MNDQVSRAEFAGFKEELKGDLGDIKSVLGRLAEAMTHLAIIDERQQSQTSTNEKILGRLDGIESRQHAAELSAARTEDMGTRVVQLETSVREMIVEREKDKAKQDGMVKMVRLMWAGVPALAAGLMWAVKSGFVG